MISQVLHCVYLDFFHWIYTPLYEVGIIIVQYFIDEETKAQRGQVTCLKSQSLEMAEPEFIFL